MKREQNVFKHDKSYLAQLGYQGKEIFQPKKKEEILGFFGSVTSHTIISITVLGNFLINAIITSIITLKIFLRFWAKSERMKQYKSIHDKINITTSGLSSILQQQQWMITGASV